MKVLIISRGIPTLSDPLNGVFEYEQALSLHNQGVEVVMAYIDRRTHVTHKRRKELKLQQSSPFPVYGGYVWPVVTYRFLPRLATWVYNHRFLNLFKKIMEKEKVKPDIIHCHYLFSLPCALAIGRKYNIPVIETEHWSELKKSHLSDYVSYLSKYYKEANEIVTVSDSLCMALHKNFGVSSKRIYNMVASDYFCDLSNKIKVLNNMVRFISIGSLVHRKGYDILLEALALSGRTDWSLTIVGEGIEHNSLDEKIRENRLQNYVKLVGLKNKLEIKKLLSSSDVFVLASRSETFGVAYIEAIASGLPVIATKCGGPEEFMTEEVGKLIETNNVEELKDSLLWMMDHFKEYDNQRLQEWCRERFSPETIAKKYIEVYNDKLSK